MVPPSLLFLSPSAPASLVLGARPCSPRPILKGCAVCVGRSGQTTGEENKEQSRGISSASRSAGLVCERRGDGDGRRRSGGCFRRWDWAGRASSVSICLFGPCAALSGGPNKKLPPPCLPAQSRGRSPSSCRAPLPPCTGSRPSNERAARGCAPPPLPPAVGPRPRARLEDELDVLSVRAPVPAGGSRVPETSRPEFLRSPVSIARGRLVRLAVARRSRKSKPKCAWKSSARARTCVPRPVPGGGSRARSTLQPRLRFVHIWLPRT
jgi:hypothetical protein